MLGPNMFKVEKKSKSCSTKLKKTTAQLNENKNKGKNTGIEMDTTFPKVEKFQQRERRSVSHTPCAA